MKVLGEKCIARYYLYIYILSFTAKASDQSRKQHPLSICILIRRASIDCVPGTGILAPALSPFIQKVTHFHTNTEDS